MERAPPLLRFGPRLLPSFCKHRLAVTKLFVVCQMLNFASLAGPHAPLEKSAFHRVACQSKGRLKVPARDLVPSAAKLKLAERRRVKWIRSKAVVILDRVDLFEPPFRTLLLRDCDGAVERDDRRRMYRHQRIVQRDDGFPVGLVSPGSGRVDRCDRGFDVIFGELGTAGGKLQEL